LTDPCLEEIYEKHLKYYLRLKGDQWAPRARPTERTHTLGRPDNDPSSSGIIPAPVERKEYSLLDELDAARLIRGRPEQLAIWDVTMAEKVARSILLQPPAQLVFEIPTGARGKLVTAAALHPDVWEKAESGGCEFCIRVDGRLAFVLGLDPVRLPSDRRWHEILLEIPESATGQHKVTLETKGMGAIDFRWALWRDPRFKWTAPADGQATAISSEPFTRT
jgi:hypothetical protein